MLVYLARELKRIPNLKRLVEDSVHWDYQEYGAGAVLVDKEGNTVVDFKDHIHAEAFEDLMGFLRGVLDAANGS